MKLNNISFCLINKIMTNFDYKFPLEDNVKLPSPSRANYDNKNIAWMIEMFASIFGKSKNGIVMKYENNSSRNKNNNIYVQHPEEPQNIYVQHPNDKSYYDDAIKNGHKLNPEMERYNMHAKKSQRLLNYMESSPAKIEYFQNSNGRGTS